MAWYNIFQKVKGYLENDPTNYNTLYPLRPPHIDITGGCITQLFLYVYTFIVAPIPFY